MAELGHTLLLSDDWDLMLDSGGNIRTATGSYGIAQNVANRVRLFTNDAYYDPDRGIPHFVVDLGQKVNERLVTAEIERAAVSEPGVVSAELVELSLTDTDDVQTDRVLTGDLRLVTETEEVVDVAI